MTTYSASHARTKIKGILSTCPQSGRAVSVEPGLAHLGDCRRRAAT